MDSKPILYVSQLQQSSIELLEYLYKTYSQPKVFELIIIKDIHNIDEEEEHMPRMIPSLIKNGNVENIIIDRKILQYLNTYLSSNGNMRNATSRDLFTNFESNEIPNIKVAQNEEDKTDQDRVLRDMISKRASDMENMQQGRPTMNSEDREGTGDTGVTRAPMGGVASADDGDVMFRNMIANHKGGVRGAMN